MNLEYIDEFGMIAKHGNLSEAAVELHTTQSALSRHIAALEKELGGELYDRTKTPMELTPMGEMFLRESNVIGVQYVRIMELAKRIRRQSVATVSIGGLVDPVAGQLVREARDSMPPPVRVRFDRSSTQTPFHLIREHAIDLAIEPMSDLIDIHDLGHEHLFFEEPRLVVERGNELVDRPSVAAESICDLDFVSLRGNFDHGLRKHLQQLCDKLGSRGPFPSRLFASAYATTLEELFLDGLGDAAIMLPESLALRYAGEDSPEYVSVPIDGADVAYDFHVFFAQDCDDRTRAFVEALLGRARARRQYSGQRR